MRLEVASLMLIGAHSVSVIINRTVRVSHQSGLTMLTLYLERMLRNFQIIFSEDMTVIWIYALNETYIFNSYFKKIYVYD